jgi:hypothetical protein
MSVIYLFTRYKFNWSEVEFSFFSTYAMLTSLVGKLLKAFTDKERQFGYCFQEHFFPSEFFLIIFKSMTRLSVFLVQ